MNNQNILLQRKQSIAFEKIIREDSHKFVTRSARNKFFDKLKPYALTLAIPNALAGTLGYILDGSEGVVEAIRQASLSVLPGLLAIEGLNDFFQSRKPLDNINYVLQEKRKNLTNILNMVEKPSLIVPATGVHIAINAATFYGLSFLTEKITGIDFNQTLMAWTGAELGLLNSGVILYSGNKLRNRIENYAEGLVEDIKVKSEKRLELEDLEGIVRGALKNPKETYKISVATSEKRFRGAKGALGFLGALDEIVDKDRDPTRLKPNVSLGLKSKGLYSTQSFPEFSFGYVRKKSKTDVALELARLANISGKNVEIKIHPIFRNASLNEMLSKPYEQLSNVHIEGTRDGAEYFEIKYHFEEEADSVQVTIKSREHLNLFLDLFRNLYGRPIEEGDFDAELIGLAEKQRSDQKRDSPIITGDIEKHLLDLDIDPEEFRIAHSKDPLDKLKPRKKEGYPFPSRQKEEVKPVEPEQPVSNINSLANVVLATYRAHKDRILPTSGFPALGITFEGIHYSLSPMEYSEREAKIGKTAQVIGRPIQTLKSLITEGEILPSLRQAEVAAQIRGISKTNVCGIIRELEKRISGLEVDFQTLGLSYNDFWEIPRNPQLLAERAYAVEARDKDGIKIVLNLWEPQISYKTIREESFPTGEALDRKVDDIKQARANRDFSKIGLFNVFGKSRFEKELEKPTYEVVAATEKTPEHLVSYSTEDRMAFMQNRTVEITTKDLIFLDSPVHPRESINRITNYLALLRDSINAVQ